jgi:hypothetical protein
VPVVGVDVLVGRLGVGPYALEALDEGVDGDCTPGVGTCESRGRTLSVTVAVKKSRNCGLSMMDLTVLEILSSSSILRLYIQIPAFSPGSSSGQNESLEVLAASTL